MKRFQLAALFALTLLGGVLLWPGAKDPPHESPQSAQPPPAQTAETTPSNPTETPSTPSERAQIIAALRNQIRTTKDDSEALEKLYTKIQYPAATEIIAQVQLRAFSEEEQGIYHALCDTFGKLATEADIREVATTYRKMPRSDARDDVAGLLRTVHNRNLIPALLTIVNDATQPGIREPALLAAATYATARMATAKEAETLIGITAKADEPQNAALKDGLRALTNRQTIPTILAIAKSPPPPGKQSAARILAIQLLAQLPSEEGRDGLKAISEEQDSEVAQAAFNSLERLRQTTPALFIKE